MNDLDKEFFIFGLPIETEYGQVRFLTYVEYLSNLAEVSAMSQNALHIYYQYKEYYEKLKLTDDEKEEVNIFLSKIKEETLYNIVFSREDLVEAYKKIFMLLINDEKIVLTILNDEKLFMEFRQLVLDMNMMTEALVNKNEEIQKGIDRSRRVKQASNPDKQTFSDIVSSIVVGAGIMPETVANMTVLQVYSVFYRISQFQNYSTSTLFATVAEKVQIESWNKHIDLWEQESNVISKEKFDKQFGGGF